MIAIVLGNQQQSALYGLDERLPLPLFRVVDRPIVHHVVDFLIAQGVRRFEFLLDHLPEKVESYLGDGARWGCSFNYHLLSSTCEPLELAADIAAGLNESIVLARADRLPHVSIAADSRPTLYMTGGGDWTGWAVAPAASRQLLASVAKYASGELLQHDARFHAVRVQRELLVDSPTRLLKSQEDLLCNRFCGTSIHGIETQPGIWISRNVSLHPAAELIAPVYIGPNCKIHAGVTLGPAAVISEGSVVDEQSLITNSLVTPGTYIGQGLELDSVIIDRNRLVNARMETAFLVSESFLVSGLSRQKKPRTVYRIISFVGALALLVLLLPLAALTLTFLLLTERGEFIRQHAVSMTAGLDPRQWSDCEYLRFQLYPGRVSSWWVYFVAEVWPGLLAVLKGDLYLVGVKPRSRREIGNLPDDWKSIYLDSKAGLITEAFVMFGRTPSDDELYTAEAYYTAMESVWHDLRLLRLYLQRMLLDSGRMPTELPEETVLGSTLEKVAER